MRSGMRTAFLILCIIPLLLGPGQAAEDEPAQEAKKALERASEFLCSISYKGGYAGIYSADLKMRYGEALYEPAKLTEIWVQPPGTPTVGECFLRAFRVTGRERYLDAARDAARALSFGQRTSGGWDHRVDLSHFDEESEKPERKKGWCTFDDNITQGALGFLISLDGVIDEAWLSESIDLGLRLLLESQFENGAWPQWYPLRGGYHDCYTFNDRAINDCIAVLLKAHKAYGREECLGGARRGGDFIVLSQGKAPQPGWAQQYSHDMKPAWARSFEPPGFCSAVTARNVGTLVDLHLHTGDPRYLEPVRAALAWLERSRLDDGTFARFYEAGTNKPIYGDRDGKVHYTLEEISEERKTGYAWQGDFGVDAAARYFKEVSQAGAEAFLARSPEPLTPSRRRQRLEALAPGVRKVIEALDDQGRWLREGMIRTEEFVKNAGVLLTFIELAEGGGRPGG